MPVTPLPPGTPSTGYYIEDEDLFTGNAAQFAGSLFDVVVPDGAGGYLSRAVSESKLKEVLGVNLGPNLRPDGFKSVRHLTRVNNPSFDQASDHALDELDTLQGCLGTTCYVDFEKVRYVLRYDAQDRPGGLSSGPQCWRDGHMAYPTPLVPCKWVAEDSPSAQVKDYIEYPAGYAFPTDLYIGAYVIGQTTEQFFKRRAPGGPAPAPVNGGDATYWELVSGTDVPTTAAVVLQRTLTVAQAQAYDADAIRHIDYTILRPGGNITLRGVADDVANGIPGGFASFGIWQKPDGTRAWVEYDLDTDTPVDRLGDAEADLVTVENEVGDHETRLTALELGLPDLVAAALESYSLVNFNNEVVDPAQTYGPTGAKGWQAQGLNASAFFSAGGSVRLYPPSSYTTGGEYVVRLSSAATAPLQLTCVGVPSTGITSYSIAPGQALPLVLLPAAGASSSAATATWQLSPGAQAGSGGSSGSTPPPIDYTTPVTHSAATTLTAADLGKHHVFNGTSVSLYVVNLPDPTGNAGKQISLAIDPGASGMWAITGTDIDGEAERRMWKKETALLLCTGTGWRKIAGRSIALRFTVGMSGSYGLSGLDTFPFNTVLDSSGGLPGMFDSVNYRLYALRKGSYTASVVAYFRAGTQVAPVEVFLAKNGDVYHADSTDCPAPVGPGGDGMYYGASSTPLVPTPLEAGEYMSARYYSAGGVATTYNATIRPKFSLLELVNW